MMMLQEARYERDRIQVGVGWRAGSSGSRLYGAQPQRASIEEGAVGTSTEGDGIEAEKMVFVACAPCLRHASLRAIYAYVATFRRVFFRQPAPLSRHFRRYAVGRSRLSSTQPACLSH